MDDYGISTYGDRIAEIYDSLHPGGEELAAMLRALAELAGGGRALELGIGTGRVALPLAAQGVAVHGIDASAPMVARLRAKPGGDAIPVTMGDFAELSVEGRFALVYCVFNTFFGLTTQDEQIRCFERVARRLEAGGAFLVEAFVPNLARLDGGQSVRISGSEAEPVSLELTRHDAPAQRLHGQRVVFGEAGTRLYPIRLRYAWPSELDLMARLAGLRLRERRGDWTGAPFTAASSGHISIYERAEGG